VEKVGICGNMWDKWEKSKKKSISSCCWWDPWCGCWQTIEVSDIDGQSTEGIWGELVPLLVVQERLWPVLQCMCKSRTTGNWCKCKYSSLPDITVGSHRIQVVHDEAFHWVDNHLVEGWCIRPLWAGLNTLSCFLYTLLLITCFWTFYFTPTVALYKPVLTTLDYLFLPYCRGGLCPELFFDSQLQPSFYKSYASKLGNLSIC